MVRVTLKTLLVIAGIISVEFDGSAPIIKSREDLRRYLDDETESPFDKLPSALRDRFVEALVFTERGVISYAHLDIQLHLSAADIYRLLSLFGLEHTISAFSDLRVDTES